MPEGETQPLRELPRWTQTRQFEALVSLVIPNYNDKQQRVASGFARQEFAQTLADLGDNIGAIIEKTAQLRPGPEVGTFTTDGLESITERPLTKSEKTLAAIIAVDSLTRLATPLNRKITDGADFLAEDLAIDAKRLWTDNERTGIVDGTTTERVKAITRVVRMVIGLPYNKDDSTNAPLKNATDRAIRNNKETTKTIVTAATRSREIIEKYGTYPRVEYDPGDKPPEIKSHEYRMQRLRIPFLREFFAVASRIRQFKNEIAPILGRRKEFAKSTQDIRETHRTLAALFSGIYKSVRFGWLMDKSLDRATDRESNRIASLIRSGYNVVDTLVVGSGLHASVFAGELRHLMPDAEMLLVDGADRLGGQFAEAETEKYYLNSRTRPENRLREGVPGRKGNLNSLGPHAVVHVPDLTGETYTPQRTIARAIRTNDLLSAPTLIRSTVTGILPLGELAQRRFGAKYAVNITVREPDGERALIVYTNRVINFSGLGEEAFPGIDTQLPRTRQLLERARLDLARGMTPKVLHSSWYWKATGNGGNEFPRRDFTGDVMVIGDGDSAYAVLEDLLGYGPDTSASVHQLDWPQNITWVGQDATDKKGLLERLRPRYARVSLDMPRPEYTYSRIRPEEGRAFTISEEDNGRITVQWEAEDGVKRKTVDRVIFATGYQDRSPQIVDRQLFAKRVVDEEDIYTVNGTIRPQYLVAGCVFESPLGVVKTRIVSVSQRNVRIAVSLNNGKEEVESIPKKEFALERFARVTIPTPTVISATDPVRSDGRTIARQIPKENIYYGGTAGQIPLQRGDNINSSFFEIIPENTAAGFLIVPRTVRLARQIAADIREAQKQPTDPSTKETSLIGALTGLKKRPTQLDAPLWRRITGLGKTKQLVSERFYSKPSPFRSLSDPRVAAQLPRALDQEDWLHVTMGAILSDYRFPPRKATYTFRIRRQNQVAIGEEFSKPFIIETDAPIDESDPDWIQFAQNIAANADFAAILDKRTRQPKTRLVNPRSKTPDAGKEVEDRTNSIAVLTIPVDSNGVANVHGIRLEPV